MTRYADADKLNAIFSFDEADGFGHLNERGLVPIPLVKESIKTCIVNNVTSIKHGYWINPHWKNSNYCYNCSKCRSEAMHEKYEWAKQGIYPICPSCGARMNEENK